MQDFFLYSCLCFNPLPSPKQGETYRRLHEGVVYNVFQSAPLTEARGDLKIDLHSFSFGVSIRSPHRSKGRRDHVQHWSYSCDVSIRSPHRSKGRLMLLATAAR